MLFRLLSAIVVFVFALIGTACGNVLRVALDKKYREKYVTPDTDDLIITGVLSNGAIATVIAILTGSRRLWGAFVGGTILTLILGDRLDRNPDELLRLIKPKSADDTESKTTEQKSADTNGTAHPQEAMPTNGFSSESEN